MQHGSHEKFIDGKGYRGGLCVSAKRKEREEKALDFYKGI